MSSSSQFRSVLDSGNRDNSPRIQADRITRRRSPSRRRDGEEEEVILPRVPQPYRTSLSAVAAPIRMKKSDRSRSVSPGGSLISGRSRSKSPGNRRSSPKHVTYDERVTVRHSDTEDSLVTDLSGRDSSLEQSPQNPSSNPVESVAKPLQVSPVSSSMSPEEHHAVELRQTCLEITDWYSQAPSQGSSSPGSTMDRLQVNQPYCAGGSLDQSSDFFTSSPGRGDSGVYTDGENPTKRSKVNIEKDYNHDRTISYRMAIKAHYSDEVKTLAAANIQEICPPMNVSGDSRSPLSPSSEICPRTERSNTLPTNTITNSDRNLSVSKKSVSSSIGNFFRKISPRLSRREKHGRSSSSGSAQSLDTSTNESNQSLDRSRGSKTRRSFMKLLGRARSRSHSHSKSSDQEDDIPVGQSGQNVEVRGNHGSGPGSNPGQSLPNSSHRILKSIEQNKGSDKSVYQRFKDKQAPAKTGGKLQTVKSQAVKVSPEASRQPVETSKTDSRLNKENEVGFSNLSTAPAIVCPEIMRASPPQTLNVRPAQERPLLKNIHMVSCDESIGDCSLDINLDGAEPALLNTSLVSTSGSKQVILSQDNLDCPIEPSPSTDLYPGSAIVPRISLATTDMQLSHPAPITGLENGALSRHSSTNSATDISPRDNNKVPSYLKLSCAVSGYGRYSSYSSRKDIHICSPGNSVSSLRSDGSSSDSFGRTNSATRAASLPLNFTKNHLAEVKSVGQLNGRLGEVLSNGHSGVYPTGDVIKDGQYYLDLCQTEEERLLVLCGQAKGDMGDTTLPEEANGRIRAAIGKTNLLITKKCKQFRGLCQKHMKPDAADRPTKWEDLQGFWDMVKLQIDDLDELFAEIAFMRQNEWKDVPIKLQSARSSANSSPKSPSLSLSSTPSQTPGHTPGHTPASRRKPVNVKDTPDSSPEKSVKSRQAAKAREDARKRMLAEKRAAMKQQKLKAQEKLNSQEVEIYLPDGVKQ